MQIPISLPVLAGVCLTAELLCQQQPPAAPAPAPVKATVSGRVSLAEADRTAAKPLEVGEEAAKGCGVVDKSNPYLQLDAKGGLAYAVVTISVKGQAVKPLEKPAQVDQRSCRFEPYVTVVPAGSSVEFKNSDTVNHNVNLSSRANESMNPTLAPGTGKTVKFEKSDRMQVNCNTHTWMKSWVVATDTNYYAVTGADGSFRIEGLPAGEHKLEVWHPEFKRIESKVVVDAEGKAAPVELELAREKKGGGRRP